MKRVSNAVCYGLFSVGLLAGLLGAAGEYTPLVITWNRTESFPLGLYVGWKEQALERNQLVLTGFNIPLWAGSRFYARSDVARLKRVVGLPGDTLYVIKDAIWICSPGKKTCLAGGKLLKSDTAGRAMVWPTWSGTVIPPGYFYAYAPHVKSFDSRYVGLQPQSNLIAKLWGGLTTDGWISGRP